MKSRGRRALDFIRIILSFSSSPDFSTKNVRICDKYVSIWCHGGDHSKWSNFAHYSSINVFNTRSSTWLFLTGAQLFLQHTLYLKLVILSTTLGGQDISAQDICFSKYWLQESFKTCWPKLRPDSLDLLPPGDYDDLNETVMKPMTACELMWFLSNLCSCFKTTCPFNLWKYVATKFDLRLPFLDRLNLETPKLHNHNRK